MDKKYSVSSCLYHLADNKVQNYHGSYSLLSSCSFVARIYMGKKLIICKETTDQYRIQGYLLEDQFISNNRTIYFSIVHKAWLLLHLNNFLFLSLEMYFKSYVSTVYTLC